MSNVMLEVVPFESEIAFQAGRMILRTSSLGLSLDDRACLAAAAYLNLEAITTDKVWSN